MFGPYKDMPRINRGMVNLGACLIAGIRLAREKHVSSHCPFSHWRKPQYQYCQTPRTKTMMDRASCHKELHKLIILCRHREPLMKPSRRCQSVLKVADSCTRDA